MNRSNLILPTGVDWSAPYRTSQHLSVWLAVLIILVWLFVPPRSQNPHAGDAHQQTPAGLSCNDTIIVSLNADCRKVITPDMVLDGNLDCFSEEDFTLQINDPAPSNGAILDGKGTFIYQIDYTGDGACPEAATFESCWGYIRAEDKTPPRLECPPDTDLAVIRDSVQFISDTLPESDPSLIPEALSCLEATISQPELARPYGTITFRVTRASVYHLELEADWQGGAAAGLYRAAFNPLQPCRNFLHSARPVEPGTGVFPQAEGVIRIDAHLRPGQSYTLLTLAAPTEATGPYQWAARSNGRGRLQAIHAEQVNIRLPLFCSDVDTIFGNSASLQYLGDVTLSDNCGQAERSFSDRILPTDACEAAMIERTFRATDSEGNEDTCIQKITIRPAGLEDVVLPARKAFVSCSETVALDEKGHPAPAVTGRPYIRGAFGPQFLDAAPCDLRASYQDIAIDTLCENTYRIFREWTIADWCASGEETVFTQHITVGDVTGPEFECPNPEALLFSNSPFGCEGSFALPAPVNVRDDCSGSWDAEVQVLTPEGELVTSAEEDAGELLVTGLPVGEYLFRYILRDPCGNETLRDCPGAVLDRVAPVAVCTDQLNISIGEGGVGSIGVTKIDGGSTDNCDADVRLATRRIVPESCLDAYRAQVDSHLIYEDSTGRYYTPWSDQFKITCCDLGQRVRIELRAADAAGNSNICWLEATVEDKLAPRCLPPADTVVPCTDIFGFPTQDTLALQERYGEARARDNCQVGIRELPPLTKLDNCGAGTLERRFVAADAAGNLSDTCRQIITLTTVNEYEIKFPKDVDNFECSDPPIDTLQSSTTACDLLAVSRDTTRFAAAERGCYKWVIRHRLINWCEYEEGGAPLMIRRDFDEDEDFAECTWVEAGEDEAVYACSLLPAGVPSRYAVQVFGQDNDTEQKEATPREIYLLDAAGQPSLKLLRISEDHPAYNTDEDCKLFPGEGYAHYVLRPFSWTRGFYEYSQVIWVQDRTPPTIFTPSTEPNFCLFQEDPCKRNIDLPISAVDDCNESDLQFEVLYDEHADGEDIIPLDSVEGAVIGKFPKLFASGRFPVGRHVFIVQVTDACGNMAAERAFFRISDCKAPAPVCIEEVSAELQPLNEPEDVDGDGSPDVAANTIWAQDLIASPIDDCTGIVYSINREGELPDINRKSLTVTCSDPQTLNVEVYAWDGAMNPEALQPDGALGGPNYDFCRVRIKVQDNRFNLCGRPDTSLSLTGEIATEEGVAVQEVQMALSGPAPRKMTTGPDGNYRFGGLTHGWDYSLRPRKEGDPYNGISTYDIVLISQHILGIAALNSPYKRMAADINQSGAITTIDLIQLRRVILNIDNRFPDNKNWRFLPAAYRFEDAANPWTSPLPEFINVNDLRESRSFDFIAIKTGDVNASVRANELQAAARSAGAALKRLAIKDQRLTTGQRIAVPVSAGDLSRLAGLQFTLAWDSQFLACEGLKPGIARRAHIGHFPESSRLTFSYNQQLPHPKPVDTVLFTLYFRSLSAGPLSRGLYLKQRPTPGEAYDSRGQVFDLQLDFAAPASLPPTFRLLSQHPNPFRDQTRVEFYLPRPEEVTLRVHDPAGKLLLQRRQHFSAGAQHFNIDQLQNTGLLFFSLQTAGEMLTGRMMRIGRSGGS